MKDDSLEECEFCGEVTQVKHPICKMRLAILKIWMFFHDIFYYH